MIYLIALMLGVGIPVGIIYLIELTKFKIEGRADVEKLTSVPVVGDIPLTDEKNDKNGSIAVFENKNNLMSETFRNIRTNLQFMLDNDQKVILVTSTVSGEGKSFVSSNLAISLSLLGKKVVIVGLDIRKPGLNKVFQLSNKERGITQYLSNPETDLMELVQPSDVNKNLFILPGGTVPPNPTELLARNGLDRAIETLKKNFDYVILDTAPIGTATLVLSDSIINRTSFKMKGIELPTRTASGTMYVSGHLRGQVSGVLDGEFTGTIRGDMHAIVSTSTQVKKLDESEAEGGEDNA